MKLPAAQRVRTRNGPSTRRRPRWLIALGTCVAMLSLTTAGASAQTYPSGGDFQSTPPTWTATGNAGLLSSISAAQASQGANDFYRTTYNAFVGASVVELDASETITSPNFTWSLPSPAQVTMTLDDRASLGTLVGDQNDGVGIDATLHNLTTGTSTALLHSAISTSSTAFSTVTAPVTPSLLINGDSYSLSVTEDVDPLVSVVSQATIDLDNVGLNVVQSNAPTFAAGSAAITNPTSSGATATATVDPGTSATTVTVNYGTSQSYGHQVSQTIPADAGPTTVTIPIVGLSGSTAYDADIVATNPSGTATSSNLTFSTTATAGNPPTLGAASVTGTPGQQTATLGSTVDAGGQGASYEVQYGTTSFSSTTSPQTIAVGTTGAQPVSVPLTGLTPGTAYEARLVSSGPGGTSTGATVNFTTAASTPPTVTTPTFTTLGANGTEENGSVIVNPGSDDTQISLNYGTTTAYGNTVSVAPVPAGAGATTVTLPVSGLTPGTTYHADVTATNADGTVASSDETFTPMPTVQGSAAAAGSNRQATVGASADVDGQAASYHVRYGTTTQYGTVSTTETLPAGTSGVQPLSSTLAGLTPGTTYHAQIVLVVGSGTSYGADTLFTTAAAAAPATAGLGFAANGVNGTDETGSVTVSPGSDDTQVSLNYGMSTSYGNTVTAQTVPGGSGATTVTIPLSGLVPGTTYHADVTATNLDGTVTSADEIFTPTPTVQGSTATADASDPGATVQAGADLDGQAGTYVVRYGTSTQYGSSTTPQTIPAGSSGTQNLSSTLAGLAPGTTYHAQVVLTIGSGTAYGADVSFTTPAAAVSGNGAPGTGTPMNPGSSGSSGGSGGSGGDTSSGSGTGAGVRPGSGGATGASCIAGYVSGSSRALRLLKVAAAAEVTAGHPLRIAVTRAAQLTRPAGYRIGAGTATVSRTGRFTVALGRLRIGRATSVRVVMHRRGAHRPLHVALTVRALPCGAQLTATHPTSSALALSLRSPQVIRQATFTLPRGWKGPSMLTVTTATGQRSMRLSSTRSGIRLSGAANGPTLTRRGLAITVSRLQSTTTGITLRFPTGRAGGTVAVRLVRTGTPPQTLTIRIAPR